MKLLLICAAALSLTACNTLSGAKNMTPEQTSDIIKELIKRCGGKFEAEAGADAGQLGGTIRASAKANAECPVPAQPLPQ